MTENGQLYISHGDGWTHIGETDGLMHFDHAHLQPAEPLAIQWPPAPLTVTIKVDTAEALDAIAMASGHADLFKHLWDNPGSHSHCRTCHPEQDRRPLAVDGQEHNRRRKARMKRKRG